MLFPMAVPNTNKLEFELKFNETKGIEKAFHVKIIYDQDKNIPLSMQFLKFDNDKHINKAKLCLHNCIQNKQIRFFIKYVPEGIKPFSLKLTTCPDCGAPVAYKFIVYMGDLKMYPKIKDMKSIKKKMIRGEKVEIPRATETTEQRIGVK